jgi:hypothetical protein
MRANKTACLLMISIILLLIRSAWGNEKITIERLGIDILLPNNYKIIPHSQWKSDLAIGQQFIMKNPFDFDYLIQKTVQKGKDVIPFETSFFLIKSKHTRRITDEEFKHYVNKYYLNWDAAIKEKQDKGLVSNLLKSEVVQLPIVDYQHKTLTFKVLMELGKIKQIQFMYSAFFSLGNLVILFTPTSKSDEVDFDFVITNISQKTE